MDLSFDYMYYSILGLYRQKAMIALVLMTAVNCKKRVALRKAPPRRRQIGVKAEYTAYLLGISIWASIRIQRNMCTGSILPKYK